MLSTTTSARPDLAAYRRSVEFPFPELAQQLVGVLGKKLTAYVGGLKQARTVDGWIAGAQPYGDAEDRIRATYRIASADHVANHIADTCMVTVRAKDTHHRTKADRAYSSSVTGFALGRQTSVIVARGTLGGYNDGVRDGPR